MTGLFAQIAHVHFVTDGSPSNNGTKSRPERRGGTSYWEVCFPPVSLMANKTQIEVALVAADSHPRLFTAPSSCSLNALNDLVQLNKAICWDRDVGSFPVLTDGLAKVIGGFKKNDVGCLFERMFFHKPHKFIRHRQPYVTCEIKALR
jgi:hypothetical protein